MNFHSLGLELLVDEVETFSHSPSHNTRFAHFASFSFLCQKTLYGLFNRWKLEMYSKDSGNIPRLQEVHSVQKLWPATSVSILIQSVVAIAMKYSHICLWFPWADTPGTWSARTCSLWSSSRWPGCAKPPAPWLPWWQPISRWAAVDWLQRRIQNN